MPQTFAPLNTTREERGKAITEKKGQIWRYSNGLYRSGHSLVMARIRYRKPILDGNAPAPITRCAVSSANTSSP